MVSHYLALRDMHTLRAPKLIPPKKLKMNRLKAEQSCSKYCIDYGEYFRLPFREEKERETE